MATSGQRRTYVLFAVLAVYIILQFIWWAVLLVRKDDAALLLAAQVEALGGTPVLVPGGERAKWMIAGEGFVFLLIVLVVLYLTLRAIRRDLSLARDQRNFLLAVTHELRTPIAAIKLQLQTLARPELTDRTKEELVKQAVLEADRLAALTEKVLHATRTEDKGTSSRSDEVDVMEFLRSVVDQAQRQLAPHHLVILEGPRTMKAVTDPEALRTITDNLIENAAKYTADGSQIRVEVQARREGWRLMVCDEGPGVPESERERIFEKFYRSGNEETRHARGTGLGLYIVRQLVEQLGGGITVRTRQPRGSIFVASFPFH